MTMSLNIQGVLGCVAVEISSTDTVAVLIEKARSLGLCVDGGKLTWEGITLGCMGDVVGELGVCSGDVIKVEVDEVLLAVEELRERGLPCDVKGYWGAIQKDDAEGVSLLLTAGADPGVEGVKMAFELDRAELLEIMFKRFPVQLQYDTVVQTILEAMDAGEKTLTCLATSVRLGAYDINSTSGKETLLTRCCASPSASPTHLEELFNLGATLYPHHTITYLTESCTYPALKFLLTTGKLPPPPPGATLSTISFRRGLPTVELCVKFGYAKHCPSALIRACTEGNADVVRYLLTGADPVSPRGLDRVPLIEAILSTSVGSYEALCALLDNGADCNEVCATTSPCTVLDAVFTTLEANGIHPTKKKLRRLLQAGVSFNTLPSTKPPVALWDILSKSDYPLNVPHGYPPEDLSGCRAATKMQLVHLNRASIGSITPPLHNHARYDKINVLKMCLERGADPDERDVLGRTALFYANLDGQNSLLDAGADPNVLDVYNCTPWGYITKLGGAVSRRLQRVVSEGVAYPCPLPHFVVAKPRLTDLDSHREAIDTPTVISNPHLYSTLREVGVSHSNPSLALHTLSYYFSQYHIEEFIYTANGLCQNGADVSWRGPDGRTALETLMWHGEFADVARSDTPSGLHAQLLAARDQDNTPDRVDIWS